jgi:aspartate kinase
MDQIRYANVPLCLKNVFNPKKPGTIIYPSQTPSRPPTPESLDEEASEEKGKPPSSAFMLENGYHGKRQERRTPTAVTVKDSIFLVNVACNRNTKSQGFLTGVFKKLDERGITADLVTTSERNVSLAIQSTGDEMLGGGQLANDLRKFGKVFDILIALARLKTKSAAQVVVAENMSIVTVVGHKMRNVVGVSSKRNIKPKYSRKGPTANQTLGEILSALAAAKINIYLVSQGATEISVS